MTAFMRTRAFAAVFVAAVLVLAPLAQAHEGATGATAQRMQAMTELGQALKSVMQSTGADQGETRAAALTALREGAMRISALFEERHLPATSEALPAIWDDPEAFDAAVDELVLAVAALAKADADADPEAFAVAQRQVAASCQSCHDDFRLKN